jgi:predicted transposase YbfD/YdcC
MDLPQYTSLLDALAAVPDPRHRRGCRYAWPFLLALIAAALASGQQHPSAIAHWIHLHGAELQALWPQPPRALPSPSTVQRTLHNLDPAALEGALAALLRGLPPAAAPEPSAPPPRHEALATDGKLMRGAAAHGVPCLLVGLVRHDSAVVLDQVPAAAKDTEQAIVPALLARADLRGKVVTVDALHTTAALARQILRQGGHYLMVVKKNRRGLFADIELLFTSQLWGQQPAPGEYSEDHQTTKGHGRLEYRQVESSNLLNAYLDWPGVGAVLRRTCERYESKSRKRSVAVHYGITDLRAEDCPVAELAQYWRGHWTIENKVHYVRDVTMGEDQGQSWRGNGPTVLAALRNAILNVLRGQGWTNIAAALREYAASATRALQLVMARL